MPVRQSLIATSADALEAMLIAISPAHRQEGRRGLGMRLGLPAESILLCHILCKGRRMLLSTLPSWYYYDRCAGALLHAMGTGSGQRVNAEASQDWSLSTFGMRQAY